MEAFIPIKAVKLLVFSKKNKPPKVFSAVKDPLWCLGAESNHRHEDFQSSALPTELPRQIKSTSHMYVSSGMLIVMATRKGLEPSTSSVTG